MKKMIRLAMCISTTSLLSVSAETNALIEVKLFKAWVIKGEHLSGNFNLAIQNTGTDPIRLAKHPVNFEVGQLVIRPLPHNPRDDLKQEEEYQMIALDGDAFFSLPPGETHVYVWRKFYLDRQTPFSKEMNFTVSIYLGKGFWLNSEPLTVQGIIPDAVEQLASIKDNTKNIQAAPRKLSAVTYKNERWLYSNGYFPICPLSPTNKIRIEPHDDVSLFKIWDGDKSMIYDMNQFILTEAPDENDVFGKWTRERKQKAEVDNAEVRRKKAEMP